MQCKGFSCVYDDEGECEAMDSECIGNLCENFQDCHTCQQLKQEACEGRGKRSRRK